MIGILVLRWTILRLFQVGRENAPKSAVKKICSIRSAKAALHGVIGSACLGKNISHFDYHHDKTFKGLFFLLMFLLQALYIHGVGSIPSAEVKLIQHLLYLRKLLTNWR